MENLPVIMPNAHKKPRGSVSAEAFGGWNKKSEFEAKVV
jgi:hypothetical protein